MSNKKDKLKKKNQRFKMNGKENQKKGRVLQKLETFKFLLIAKIESSIGTTTII